MSLGDDVSVLTEGPLIWAIDDESEILKLLEALLREGGYRYEGFLDPRPALERARAPDLILLDLMIPAMSGFEVLRALRSTPRFENVPVVVLTAASSESVMVNAFESGADDVLYKPFNVLELTTRVRWQLRRSERMQEDVRSIENARLLESLALALLNASDAAEVLSVLQTHIVTPLGLTSCRLFAHRDGTLREAGPSEQTLDLSPWPELAEALAAQRTFPLGPMWARALGREDDAHGVMIPLVSVGGPAGLMCAWWEGAGRADLRELLCRAEPMVTSALLGRHAAQTRQRTSSDFDVLADTRDFLANIIAASPDPIVAADEDGVIKVFNPAAEETLGYQRAEALGRDVRMLYPEGEAEAIMREMRADPRGRLEKTRWSLLDCAGRAIPVELSAVILYRSGRESGSVGLFRDLRDHIEIQERLARVTQHLEQSKEHAMIAEIAGATAHELNQPLTSLLGYAELLGGADALAPQLQKAVDVIGQESERIARIVRKLSSVTQYRTKDYVGGTRIVDLGEEE